MNTTEFEAHIVDGSDSSGYLSFSNEEIAFYAMFKNGPEVHIPIDSVTSVGIRRSGTITNRVTLTRLFLLKWWAMAFPKREGSADTMITIYGASNQVTFSITSDADTIIDAITPLLDAHTIPLETNE